MNLNDLFENIAELKQPIVIRDLKTDSRLIEPGDLFLAYIGEADDGRQYIAQAKKRGALAIAYEPSDGYSPPNISIPCISIRNLKEKLGHIAAKFYGNPSQSLKIFGVTGTNGKTSCVYFLAQLLTHLNKKVGLLSTIGNGIYPNLKPSRNTTVGAVEIQKSLAEFKKANCEYVCMEVSSHSLMQHRVDNVKFNTVIFTNLSRDHLDYHHNMEQYFRAKQSLFKMFNWVHAIVNIDDIFGRRLLESLQPEKKSIIGYSLSSVTSKIPLISFSDITTRSLGFHATLNTPFGNGNCDIPVLGSFNLYNVLSAVSALLSEGLTLKYILQVISSLKMPKGRMEMIHQSGKPTVIIDFAHTPDALEKVLKALRPFCKDKLWCIFGCGGDRDKGKRKLMAQAVECYADRVVLTSDNPRSEPMEKIIRQIREGFTHLNTVYEEVDRKKAIQYAITAAGSDDMILIAGKGHETYQEIKGIRYPFDEYLEVKKLFENLILMKRE